MAERDHHSIGEVLAMVQEDFPDVTISKIRFLESQGLLEPDRTTSGYRKFFDDDVERLRWILHQQRDHYLPLKVIKDRIQSGLAEPSGTGSPAATHQNAEVSASTGAVGSAAANTSQSDEDASVSEATPDSTRAPTAEPDPAPAQPTPSRTVADASPGGAVGRGSNPLDDGQSTVSMTADELAGAAGISAEIVDQLRSFGLIEARTIGSADLFEGEALQVARLAGQFIEHGVEVRHLKMYRTSADREAGFYEQVVSPLSGHRDPATRSRARSEVRDLVRLGNDLKASLLRRALREQLGGP